MNYPFKICVNPWYGGVAELGLRRSREPVAFYGLVGSNPTPTALNTYPEDLTQTNVERRWGWAKNPWQTNELKAQNLNKSEKIIVLAQNMEFTVFESHPHRNKI
jgi:hypothetical protein